MNEPVQKSIHHQYQPLLTSLARLLGGPRIRLQLARIFYHLQVTGGDFIPPEGGCLVAFNHVSDIADTMVYLAIQYYRPEIALFAWGLNQKLITGLMKLHRGSGIKGNVLPTDMRPAYNAGELLQARQLLAKGGCVAIAPEGETTWDGRLQSPFAPGAAWLAFQTGVPVIPIVSRGGYDIQPLWRREKICLTGRMGIHIGSPLVFCDRPLAHVGDVQLQKASDRIRQAMIDLLGRH